jgi:hypothetical protein
MPLRLAARPLKHLKKLLPFGKSIEVKRTTSAMSYLEKQGWQLAASTTPPEWRGCFRTGFGSYKGRITASTPPQYYIYKPPAGLTTLHVHKRCFHPKPDGWCWVHFQVLPKDLDSGVILLERILCEAYLLTQKSA